MGGAADDETWTGALQPYTAATHTPSGASQGASQGASDDDTQGRVPGDRTWRHELPRWLASLNPGRTPREYEKAIGYFFDTPGVPQELVLVTFDLLLAYRGALALRAAPQERGASYQAPTWRQAREHLAPSLASSPSHQALPRADEQVRSDDGYHTPCPLAPATVNLRLTALRQFLVHCAMLGLLLDLSPDHIRAALRRLPVEHRRPYQILDEAEWDGFLQAALLPAGRVSGEPPEPPEPPEPLPAETSTVSRPPGPWGTPRAARLSTDDIESSKESYPPEKAGADDAQPSAVVRSRFGLTGARTAQRDHALVSLALATGLRAIELAQLDIGDLQREWHGGHEEWWLVLPDAKTKGQKGGRTLPLAPSLVQTLMDYIRSTDRKWEDPNHQSRPLFVAAYKRHVRHVGELVDRASKPSAPPPGRLLAGQIARIVDRVEAQWLALRAEESARGDNNMQAGETRSISTHALRHSTAVALLAGNESTGRPPASVEHVRGWLGHFDIRTTQGYLAHLDARRHRRPFVLAPGGDTYRTPPAPEVPSPLADTREAPTQSDDDREHDSH